MPKYLVMPEGSKWYEVDRTQTKLEVIYRLECSFFLPKTRIAIRNLETQETEIFTREEERVNTGLQEQKED